MITVNDYFAGYPRHKSISPEHIERSRELLKRVNALLAESGLAFTHNPATGSMISGKTDGGWRPPECPTGAPQSAHKTGEAVDVYDPANVLDRWITNDILEAAGLYREDPAYTNGWCHLTTRAPKSGKRTFRP